jgi:hypothetical protein
MTTLNALPRHWEPFLQSISGRADLPEFDCLWTDCTQEETKLIARGVQDSHHDDNQSLAFHAKRGRRNRRSFSKAFKDKKTSVAPSHEQRKDISRIQCFRCDKYGHVITQFVLVPKGRAKGGKIGVIGGRPIIVTLIRHLFLFRDDSSGEMSLMTWGFEKARVDVSIKDIPSHKSH